MQQKPKIIEMDIAELETILQHCQQKGVDQQECEKLASLLDAYKYLLALIEADKTSLRRLRKLLFGASTEKTDDVLNKSTDSAPSEEASNPDASSSSNGESDPPSEPKKPRKGHGRNGADDYPGAKTVEVSHSSLQAGDPCPDCGQGTVYDTGRPGVLIRFVAHAPLEATVYRTQKLRCSLCGKLFTADLPQDAGTQKYDPTVGSMIGLLKYGSGLPFNRLQRLQDSLGMRLPASTQWSIVRDSAQTVYPAYAELIRQAAQGEVIYNDDTTIKILELMGSRAKQEAFDQDTQPAAEDSAQSSSERTGLFTSGIVSTTAGRQIALFFSGRKHAGENLCQVLAERATELEAPIQMCDALSRNMPQELKTILANCLAHARRHFVDLAEPFPEECRYVLEALKVVYKNDAHARQQELSPEARLEFHQSHSGPIMDNLKAWIDRQFQDRLVEPNSSLGGAITYMQKHWQKLTLFLRKAGAPLDNNVCERALKKAILHRKNSLFYKTCNGARVGDIFMSLIYTCELCGANPFDYLTELQRHAEQLSANPQDWMPWNYRTALVQEAAPH